MNIIGLNFTHDASVSIFEDNNLIKHIELEKDNNERYAKSKSIDFFVKYLDYPVSEIDLIVISGSVKKIFNLSVNLYDFSHNRAIGKIIIKGVEITWMCYSHVYAHMAGTNLMSGETDYSIVFDGGVIPTIYKNITGQNGVLSYEPHKRIFYLTGLVYSIMGCYFGKFKSADVISGKSCHSLHNTLYGKYNIPGNYMSYAALGSVDDELIKEVYIKLYSYDSYNGYGFNEHDFLKYCHGLEFNTDADAIRTIHHALNVTIMDNIKNLIPKGSSIGVSGGCFLNIKLNALINKDYLIKTTVVLNDSGSSINAVCAHFRINKLYDHIAYSRFCGLEMKNIDALCDLECVSSDVSEFLNNNDEIVMSLFGKSEIGPRALGRRSLLCKPFKGSKDRLNKIKKREEYRPVSPIVDKEFIDKNFVEAIYDYNMVIENYSKYPKPNEYVHVCGSVRAMMSTDAIIQEIVHNVGGCLMNTSANELGKGFFNDYKLAIEWASMNNVGYIFDGEKVYKIPKFDPYNCQVGGSHYKGVKIPLGVFIRENNLDASLSHCMKYLIRHKEKNGIEDLKKAIHAIELYMFDLYGEKK